MPFIHVGQENTGRIELYYEDHGTGDPVVLIHGWPLSGRSWEKQVPALLEAGHRVITYDRRGFGESSHPTVGYDYDTFAKDLDTLMTRLELDRVSLVGFSMGGGEIARYLGTYGSKRVRKAAFISAITPALRKAPGNPDGVDPEVFEKIQKGLLDDRPAFFTGFFKDFYGAGFLKGNDISEEALRMSWLTAIAASPVGTHASVSAWGEDFRKDLARVEIPTLVLHGDADRTVPFEASGKRMAETLCGSRLAVIPGAPHGMLWTHAEAVNAELLPFLRA